MMENPRDAKLSEIRQLQKYQKQLGAMLPYLDKKLKRQLQVPTIPKKSLVARAKPAPAAVPEPVPVPQQPPELEAPEAEPGPAGPSAPHDRYRCRCHGGSALLNKGAA